MKKKPTISLSMDANKWRCITEYGSCVGCTPTPSQLDANCWMLWLPRIEDGLSNKIGYLLCPHTTPISASALTGTFSVNAIDGTQFADAKEPSDGVTPASISFIIMAGLDSTSLNDPDKRYWGGTTFISKLLDDETVIRVPLTAGNWTNVYGQFNQDKFTALLRSPQYVGITFGAGGDFGHGIVTANGDANLVAKNISFV